MWSDEVIKKGAEGELVTNVQKGLVFLGYDTGGVDGKYGPKTRDAVTAFQKANNLDADGIMGPNTGKVLEKVYWAKVEEQNKAVAKGAPAKAAPVKGGFTKGAPAKK